MDNKSKLILAQIQVNNLTELLQGNEYERYLFNKLVMIQVELERQLSLCTSS